MNKLYKIIDAIKRALGMHVHTKELFVIGKVCVVKCTGCGMESLPWSVPLHLHKHVEENHKDDVKRYCEIDKRVRAQ